jgi:predicted RecA/RadA family phage recombinase
MSVREQNLETVAPVFATFSIHQTGGEDDLADADIGNAVTLTGDFEIGPATNGSIVLGKLIALSLSDIDTGRRAATVQIGGVMTLPITTTYPTVGDRIVGGASGTVKQAPALASNDPAGGNIARGTVLEVNGTSSCTVYMP